MATNSKFGGKQRPGKTPAPEIELKLSELIEEEAKSEQAEPETPELIAAAPEIIEAAAEVAVEPEPFVFEAKAVVGAKPSAGADEKKKSEAAVWPLCAFEMWSENANALIDFTEELSKAKSISDVISLQSRFASERYESLVKHSNEFAEATRRFATQAGFSPLPQGFVAVFAS